MASLGYIPAGSGRLGYQRLRQEPRRDSPRDRRRFRQSETVSVPLPSRPWSIRGIPRALLSRHQLPLRQKHTLPDLYGRQRQEHILVEVHI